MLANTKDGEERTEVAGGADMRLRIPHEITHVTLHHTGDAQIFINLVDLPRLDHTYTVFAEVTGGMEVVATARL